MDTLRPTLLALSLSALLALPANGQVDRRSPEAALRDLDGDGYVSDFTLFRFRGCPQEDAVGRAVFESVQTVNLHGFGLQRMARPLMQGVYPDCNYEPLHTWVASVFQRFHRNGEAGPADMFARGLGPLIADDLQEALLAAAEDSSFGGSRSRELYTRAAFFNRPPERRIEEGIAILRRNIPGQARAEITYYLGRSYGPAFFEVMARAAPTFDDAALFGVVSAIGTDVQDRRVDPNARGLDELRTLVQARPNRPPWAEIPLAPRPPLSGRPR